MQTVQFVSLSFLAVAATTYVAVAGWHGLRRKGASDGP